MAFDQNQDGFIDASEVRSQYKGEITQVAISAFFIATDENQDGLITFDEYLAANLADAKIDVSNFSF